MSSLAFKIPSVYADLGEGEGLLSIENDQLSVEYQLKDAIIGLLKSGVQEVTVPLLDISEVVFQPKLINSKLVIRGQKMQVLAKIPGAEKGELQLNIARKDKEIAQRFVTDIMLRISELRLRDMEE